ncbi:MAG: right-handed parallel beta-helix repeat-containing protein [bacterium]
MKGFTSAVLGILGCAVPMVAAAHPIMVQGTIVSNTVWNAGHGPYLIQGKLIVAKGATLRIEPGTQVAFADGTGSQNGDSGIVVRGGLDAEGSAEKPIYFTAWTKGGKWGQVYYEQSDAAHSTLQHCVILGGRVVCKDSSPLIEECFLSGSREALVVDADSHPTITNNRIFGNAVGLTFLGEVSDAVVSGNCICDNGYGVCAASFGGTQLAQNHLFGNRSADVMSPTDSVELATASTTPQSGIIQVASLIQ